MPPPGRGRFPFGVVLWLLLAIALAVGLWLLAGYFPDSLSSAGDQVGLVRLLSILVLISSGLLFARRFNVADVVRNIAIWTGVAAFTGHCGFMLNTATRLVMRSRQWQC